MVHATSRVKGVFKPSDYPDVLDEATQKDLNNLFETLFPQSEKPEIAGNHAAFAMVARNPRLALLVVKLSYYIVREMPWTTQRSDLRELAIETLNFHFKCDFSFQAHLRVAQAAGIGVELVAAIPYWRTANVFNEEQRLVIEYTLAVVAGEVPDELFSRVVTSYGEKEAIEFTTAIAWWSFWAMIINATRTEFDFGYGKSGALK
jgi:alkylhydroperoxidase family enzyme